MGMSQEIGGKSVNKNVISAQRYSMFHVVPNHYSIQKEKTGSENQFQHFEH